MDAYDSAADTQAHIDRVRELLGVIEDQLRARAIVHDHTKFGPPEKELFDRVSPKISSTVYGSDEYKAAIAELGPALTHHYALNKHHPEHYENGINGMSLLDVIEMMCDWKAAGERYKDGSMGKSLEINIQRFGIDPQLAAILQNTRRELGW